VTSNLTPDQLAQKWAEQDGAMAEAFASRLGPQNFVYKRMTGEDRRVLRQGEG